MSRFQRLLVSMLLSTGLALIVSIALFLVLSNMDRERRHQQTVTTVREAGLRLNALPGTDGAGEAGTGILTELSRATTDIADYVRPSVVHVTGIKSMDGRPVPMSTGSGWIYDDNGHIVTNLHVVEGGDAYEIQLFDGELREATFVGGDPTTDIAVLQVRPGNLIAATRRPLEQRVRQGELCFAFGSPFDFRFSMSSGIVSGLGRFVGMYWRSGRRIGFENFIQVDAAINPGNSGGPLTDHRGHVIGMNTAIATNDADGQFAGIGLAIPLDMIESAVDQLIETGTVRKGFLGVSVLDQDDRIARFVGAPQRFRGDGVLVHSLDASHPAAKVGLRIGDVITTYDEQPVTTVDELDQAMDGDEDMQMELRVWRHGEEESGWEEFSVVRTGDSDRIGFDVIAIYDRIGDLHRALGYTRRGVVIAETQPDMPARNAGMRPGDVVHRVNGNEVQSVRQLQSSISSIPPGKTASVQAWRYDERSNEWASISFSIQLSQWQ